MYNTITYKKNHVTTIPKNYLFITNIINQNTSKEII